jgi:hypothetical protein
MFEHLEGYGSPAYKAVMALIHQKDRELDQKCQDIDQISWDRDQIRGAYRRLTAQCSWLYQLLSFDVPALMKHLTGAVSQLSMEDPTIPSDVKMEDAFKEQKSGVDEIFEVRFPTTAPNKKAPNSQGQKGEPPSFSSPTSDPVSIGQDNNSRDTEMLDSSVTEPCDDESVKEDTPMHDVPAENHHHEAEKKDTPMEEACHTVTPDVIAGESLHGTAQEDIKMATVHDDIKTEEIPQKTEHGDTFMPTATCDVEAEFAQLKVDNDTAKTPVPPATHDVGAGSAVKPEEQKEIKVECTEPTKAPASEKSCSEVLSQISKLVQELNSTVFAKEAEKEGEFARFFLNDAAVGEATDIFVKHCLEHSAGKDQSEIAKLEKGVQDLKKWCSKGAPPKPWCRIITKLVRALHASTLVPLTSSDSAIPEDMRKTHIGDMFQAADALAEKYRKYRQTGCLALTYKELGQYVRREERRMYKWATSKHVPVQASLETYLRHMKKWHKEANLTKWVYTRVVPLSETISAAPQKGVKRTRDDDENGSY